MNTDQSSWGAALKAQAFEEDQRYRRIIRGDLEHIIAMIETRLRSHQLSKQNGLSSDEGHIAVSRGVRYLRYFHLELAAPRQERLRDSDILNNSALYLECATLSLRCLDAIEKWNTSPDEVRFGLRLGIDLPLPKKISEKLVRHELTSLVGLVPLLPDDALAEACSLSDEELKLLRSYLRQYGVHGREIAAWSQGLSLAYARHLSGLEASYF